MKSVIPKSQQEDATEKVIHIRNQITDDEMAALLGMCKVTMYKRLRTRTWKKTELALINNLEK